MPDHSSTPILESQSSESSAESPEFKTTSWPSRTDTEGWTDTPVTIDVSSTIDASSTI